MIIHRCFFSAAGSPLLVHASATPRYHIHPPVSLMAVIPFLATPIHNRFPVPTAFIIRLTPMLMNRRCADRYAHHFICADDSLIQIYP